MPPTGQWHWEVFEGGSFREELYIEAQNRAIRLAQERTACLRLYPRLIYDHPDTPVQVPVWLAKRADIWPAAVAREEARLPSDDRDMAVMEARLSPAERAGVHQSILATLAQDQLTRPLTEGWTQWDEVTSSLEAIHLLFRLCRLLTLAETDQLKTLTGVYQPHIRKHPVIKQFTYPEMAKKLANELTSQPKFTAWVKIGEPFPLNPGKKCLRCGLPNKYGVLSCQECETPLPAQHEYVIQTHKPDEGVYGKDLQDRLERILERNREDGVLRQREAVEKEMRQRQGQCSQQPQLPRPEPPHPPEDEPTPTFRRVPRG